MPDLKARVGRSRSNTLSHIEVEDEERMSSKQDREAIGRSGNGHDTHGKRNITKELFPRVQLTL